VDEAGWGALALALTILGGVYTYLAYQRRGLTAAVRGGAITLLPLAAWLTGVLELLTEVGGAVGDWAADLAFSPTMWLGAGLAGLAVVMFVVSGFLADRGVGQQPRKPKAAPADRKALPPAPSAPAGPVVDDPGVDAEMAEIEAILRKRGIT
jgi:hypothetical protein